MPKRAVTPPPADDEPRYLTVVHPYPLHAHMELPKDREDFGRWLACCIGSDPFYAFFHKPSALDMVIIEVKRDYDGFDHLIGEHRWNEFLRNPSDEEKEKVTRVYHCVYNSGRQVQKNGWKRIDAQERWFRNWSPNNGLITYPYPSTHYCDIQMEDPTNHPLCRPLPVTRFPQPKPITQPVARPPPPGSAAWASHKAASRGAPARGAWGRGAPSALHIPTSYRGGKGQKSAISSKSPGQVTSSSGSSPWTQSQVSSPPSSSAWPSTSNPWSRGPISSTSSTGGSMKSPALSQRGPNSSSGVSAASSPPLQTPLSATPAVPPGLDFTPSYLPVSTSWADDIPEGLFPDLIITNAPSSLPPLRDFNPPTPPPRALDHSDVPANLEDALAALDMSDPMGYTSAWEYADASDTKEPESVTEQSGSLWDDYEEEKPVVERLLCTDHGRICKKGICKTYARQLREKEKEKKMAENPGGGRGRGRGNGRGGGRGGQTDSWRNGSQAGTRENNRPPKVAGGWKSSNSNSSESSTPLHASADDEDGFSVVSSTKSANHGRPRADSIESKAPSEASGWGSFSKGNWG